MKLRFAIGVCLLAASLGARSAAAQVSDGVVKIGILNDDSGVYADIGGPGSVAAARMAVEDAGSAVLGKPIELVAADHQNKADTGSAIAGKWFDADKVDMVIVETNSSVALAVEKLAADRNRIVIAGAVAATDFTGKACTPTAISWMYDSFAMTNGLSRSLVARGLDSWFFITVDYTFGLSLETDASKGVLASGGKVLGSARHPLNTNDFSSYLLKAQASGAKVVALANSGADMTNATKQANEFGLAKGGQKIVSLLVFLTDVRALGLEAAQGLSFLTAYYWDRDDASRAWAKRFFALRKAMPTMAQAAVYSAVRHYLRAVAAAGTDDTKAVMAKMRELPVEDFYSKNGHIREDGRLIHDMFLAEVKKPSESTGPWDYYKILATIPGDKVFRSLAESGCPLVKP
ncbi:MAG: ABC transporter substrate-binding protein, partial [Alphaproteobacteria bacterium]